jgi:hypothetical protein
MSAAGDCAVQHFLDSPSGKAIKASNAHIARSSVTCSL